MENLIMPQIMMWEINFLFIPSTWFHNSKLHSSVKQKLHKISDTAKHLSIFLCQLANFILETFFRDQA